MAQRRGGARIGLREGTRAALALRRSGVKPNVVAFQREIRRLRIREGAWRTEAHPTLNLAETAWTLATSKAEVRRLIDSGELAGTRGPLPDGVRFTWAIPLELVLEIGRRWIERDDAKKGNVR